MEKPARLLKSRQSAKAKRPRTVPAQPKFFTISGYAPVAIQMAMMRYLREHGQPVQMQTLPSGAVKIQDRGLQMVSLNGRDVQFERYTVLGLIWGMETLWMVVLQVSNADKFVGERLWCVFLG